MGFKDGILTLLFTNRCRWCGEVTDVRKKDCDRCLEALDRIDGEICLYCGCKTSDCRCKKQKSFYKHVCAPFYYRTSAEKAIHRLKFGGKTEVAELLANEMYSCFLERYGEYDFDICTFVPASKKSIKERGFNQSEMLANNLAKLAELKVAPLLVKLRDTPPQHLLPRIKRSGNLLGVIDFNEDADIDVTDMRILLVDDIKTTGATLNECAKTLMIHGAAEVLCLTAAISSNNSQY